MSETPYFSAWRARFARRPALGATLTNLRRCTLDRLEERFGAWFAGRPALTPACAPARERPYSVRRTWWCFLWQMLQANGSCRQVVRQLQALLALEGRPGVDEGTSAYCQARARLPESLLSAALQDTAALAARRAPPGASLQGRPVRVLDGTTLALPDTPDNQAAYPQPKSQAPGCGFPLLNLLVVWEARGGAVLDLAHGDHQHSELRLMHQVLARLDPQAIVIYDRALGHYVGGALLQSRGIDLISRVHTRRIDWRQGQRLGPNERLVHWPKSRQRPPYLGAAEWAGFPAALPVRLIRVRVSQPGFRTRELVLMTTLLDPVAYPAAEIAAAYRRRWCLEMCLDDLKTTLGLEALRCQSPEMIRRELLMLLTAHNLVRVLMAEAATRHAAPLDRLSFAGTLATLRSYSAACAQATRPSRRRFLWQELLRVIAADRVPFRPDRWEPRAVKRRPKDYPRLNRPRRRYRQARHGCLHRRPRSN